MAATTKCCSSPTQTKAPISKSADGMTVPHDAVLRNTMTALRAGFAEIVSSDEVIARLG